MKKIMFNDNYGLTQAVLEGRKTMTRRFAEKVLVEDENCELRWNGEFKPSRYKVGEIVAVAQSYKEAGFPPSYIIDELHPNIEYEAGWTNKMFVKASLCLHQIRITNVRVERLQDISDEDCLREGIEKDGEVYSFNDYEGFATARLAFKALIDNTSGKGTWAKNPYVFVYAFTLVK